MRSGWVSGWCVRRSFPRQPTCTGIGIAASNTMSSRAACLCAALVLSGEAAAADLRLFEAVEPHMGTLVRIKLYAAGAEQAKAAFRSGFDRIAELDRALSDYRPESELNRICRSAVRQPVRAGADVFRVLEASQKLAAETDGAF